MKKKLLSLLSALLLLSVTACGNTPQVTDNSAPGTDTNAQTGAVTPAAGSTTEDAPATAGSKILVAYFSHSGNTRTVAEAIQTHLNTDIFEITTVTPYSEDYDTVVEEAQAEQRQNARPALAAQVENMEQYDTVFLGYPNWWGDMPMALYTFLDTYDLSGKTVVPFVTSGGSGFSGTVDTIAAAEPEAVMLEGLALSGDSVDSAGDEINAWLDGLSLPA